MPSEGKTAGPYKAERVGQKPGQPGQRGSVSDVFDTESVRPSQHLIAYEWKATTNAAAVGQTPGSARLELLLRPWPLPRGVTDLPLRSFPIEPGLNLLFRIHERRRLCVGYRERATLKRLPCPQQGEELGSVERGPDYARVFQCSACAELEGVPEWLRHEAMPRWVGLETPSPAALEQARLAAKSDFTSRSLWTHRECLTLSEVAGDLVQCAKNVGRGGLSFSCF